MSSPGEGLSMLRSCYASDDSDDDVVPGPRVSTKRTAPSDLTDPEFKKIHADDKTRTVKLPVPAGLFSLFPTEIEEQKDSPEEHGGRIRSFAHERGNWATYVYIQCEWSPVLKSFADMIISHCQSSVQLNIMDDLHISLTKTVVLRYHWINSLVSSIRQSVQEFPSFQIFFDSFQVYCNEQKTRTFVGVAVHNNMMLTGIVKELDRCLSEFKLPPFYEDPSFHLSLAWCVGDHKDSIESLLPYLQDSFQQFACSQPDMLTITVNQLYCKTGNKYFVFHLKTS